MVGVAALLLGAYGIGQPGAGSELASSGCAYAPITTSWLAQQAATWGAAAPGPLVNAGVLQAASYGNPEAAGSSLSTIEADLALLKAAGVQVVRIDLNYAPWLDGDAAHIAEMDQVVAAIRADGLQLMIADSASESYWHHPQAWSTFADLWVDRVSTLGARYHPEYYEVVKEPGWYYPMIEGYPGNPAIVSVTAWTDLTERLVAAVRTSSPGSVVGVAVAAASLYGHGVSLARSYLEAARALVGVDFLGFDIYGVCDFLNTDRFLQSEGTGGKAVWVPEAWSDAGSAVYDPSRASLDVSWARVLYDFLAAVHAQGVVIFYTDALAEYAPVPSNATAALAYYTGRTPVFFTLQNLTAANRALGFSVVAGAQPSTCPLPVVNGSLVPPGGSIDLAVGSYPIQAGACPAGSFQTWVVRGNLSVRAPARATTWVNVSGAGSLEPLYALHGGPPGVGFEVQGDPCAAAPFTVGGVAVPAGTGTPLLNGSYALAAPACPGLPGVSWSTLGNVSLLPGGMLAVAGPGVVIAALLPGPPPAEVLALPATSGLLVLSAVPVATAWTVLLAVVDRRHRAGPGRARPPAPPGNAAGGPGHRGGAGARSALLALVAQGVVSVLEGLFALGLLAAGYTLGGPAGLAFLLAGELFGLLLVLLLLFAAWRVVLPLRRGEAGEAIGPARRLGLLELFLGLGVVGLLYLIAARRAARSCAPGLP